jgi:hypothetical protein
MSNLKLRRPTLRNDDVPAHCCTSQQLARFDRSRQRSDTSGVGGEAEVDVACTKHEIDRQQTSRFTEVDQIVRMVTVPGRLGLAKRARNTHVY